LQFLFQAASPETFGYTLVHSFFTLEIWRIFIRDVVFYINSDLCHVLHKIGLTVLVYNFVKSSSQDCVTIGCKLN
jgi:hypothetical protein